MEGIEQSRCRELANSSSFYSSVYSEIEEVGWENLVRLSGDLKFLSFRIVDDKRRVHCMEVQLNKNYPKWPPSVSLDAPYLFNLRWSMNSRLKDVLQQFREVIVHLEKLQEIWKILDEIDGSLWVVDMEQSSRANACRQIKLGEDSFIILTIHADNPKSLPESVLSIIMCRFIGSGPTAISLRNSWQRNSKRWSKDRPFLENIATTLGTELPRPPDHRKNNQQQVDCGICYSHYLPTDNELGAKSGSSTDFTCENTSCHRAFHSICLEDWLRSISTTRQSYDVLFGNCPYCSEPVAVKTIDAKK